MSDDPLDLSVLTPGYFLIGSPMISIPDPSRLNVPYNRLSQPGFTKNIAKFLEIMVQTIYAVYNRDIDGSSKAISSSKATWFSSRKRTYHLSGGSSPES